MRGMTLLMFALVAVSALPANPLLAQTEVRMEAGLGGGFIGEGGGLNGRLGLAVVHDGWGGLLRSVTHDGGEAPEEHGFFGPSTPKETFYETSLMLTRSFPGEKFSVLLGAGIGRMSGRRVDPADGVGLANLEATWGVPIEVAIQDADRDGLGISLLLSAHINGEASQYGLGAALTWGWVW